MCNCVLQDGRFLDELKIVRVSVVHKGGAKNDFNNYRPISVLGVFSKVIERVIHRRLSDYLVKFKLISPYQFGFQKKKSTELALLCVKERLVENNEQKLLTIGIFLDIRKAFDSVKHHILLYKLPRYGIRGRALELIESYLKDRRQCVIYGAASSNIQPILTGVPQGSILGPLLFLYK